MEHVVSRSALQSPASTPEPVPVPEINARLKELVELENVDYDTPQLRAEDEDQLDFRLFANKKTSEIGEPSKIRLKSPTPTTAEPGFLRPERNLPYYLATSPPEACSDTAVTGEQVITASTIPWPGSAYPWKVIHLPATKRDRLASVQSLPHLSGSMDEAKKRRRPGKAYRIRIRVKLASERSREELARKTAESNDVAEREKRTRRNREKKAKKKMREKAKRARQAAGEADAADETDDESESAPE